MTITVRPANQGDAETLVEVIDLASHGLLPLMWSQMVPEGASPEDVGLGLVKAEEGPFTYHSARIAEIDGAVAGGMIAYRLPDTPPPADPELPEVFAGVLKLESLAPGRWLINMIASLPAYRRRGVGRALLEDAERSARNEGCPGLALIVTATNDAAIGAYRAAGFHDVERRPFDVGEYGYEPTEAILMMKDLA